MIARMSTRARIASLIVVLAALVALGVAVADGGSASEGLKIRRPVDGARLRGTVHVLIRAPSDTQRVAFYLDGHLKNMDDAPPWRYDGSGYLRTRDLKVGRHRLTVRARRAGDKLSVVGETFYVVRVDKKPPTIAFRAPRSGATVSGVLDAGSRNCEVAAADRSGVARVDFFLDGAKLEGDSKRPFTCTLDTRTYPERVPQALGPGARQGGQHEPHHRQAHVLQHQGVGPRARPGAREPQAAAAAAAAGPGLRGRPERLEHRRRRRRDPHRRLRHHA